MDLATMMLWMAKGSEMISVADKSIRTVKSGLGHAVEMRDSIMNVMDTMGQMKEVVTKPMPPPTHKRRQRVTRS